MRQTVSYQYGLTDLKVVLRKCRHEGETFYEMSIHPNGQEYGESVQFGNLDELEDCANAILSYVEMYREAKGFAAEGKAGYK